MPIHHFYSRDYEQKTGGWIYNRHLIAWLDRHCSGVREMTVPVCFPTPDSAVMDEIAVLFDGIKPGAVVVMDHIYGCMLLPILRGRPFRLVLVYHHSMAEERGETKSPSGLPAISPTRGEKIRGALLPQVNLGGQAGLSPPPCGEGGEGTVSRPDAVATEQSALELADTIIVTSDESHAYIASRYGIAAKNIITAKPGNDPAPQSPAHAGGSWRLLSVGAVIPRKRYEFLIDALSALDRSHWSLTIVGNTERYPDYVSSLHNRIKTRGLENHITLAGELSAPALDGLWSQTHLYVASSLYEGYGMAISEALCRGVPVISTPSGAVAGWAGEAAMLVDADDPGEMAARIAAVMGDADVYVGAHEKAVRFAAGLPSWEENMAKAGEGLRRLL
ncbi:glycosyltransferase family 4 protein [Neorhizobium sp. JUb45]|uniref:glycosyltransferase family 4 protein n=1 Tax=unclassified Neorhizobium TaxID=2629175 RepID=UPI0010EB1894|nr:glycosyltransferase family 4 protein [Neorhizobium sp. JUb45]TCR04264.1 glycosyltransferase involved in cell wall biosynthesis [Neorhizobium sp. JUb45]